MKKVNPDQKQNKKLGWIIACACLVFFALGVSVPGLLGRHNADNAEMEKLQEVYSILQNNWYYADSVEDLDSELIEKAITGMTTLDEDAHTNYFSLEQAQAFSQTLSGSNVGIGISFYNGQDGQMVVKEVFINSTADTAGIQPGDEIIKVGDKDTASTSTDDLVTYIKSFDGKPLELTIVRNGQQQTVTVTPGSYDTTVSMHSYDGYGEIVLTSFSEYSGKDFADAAMRLKEAGAKDLIIDLRGNSGGYLSAARDIASTLLPDDTVIFIEQLKDGSTKELETTSSYAQVEFDHIYILQDGNSASASEVLIGALKDNLGSEKVTTIGSTTYGKGTEQVSTPFSDGTSLKYTIAEWLTPNGTSINLVGFEPDVAVSEIDAKTVRYVVMDENSTGFGADTVDANAKAVQVFLSYLGYPADRTDEYFSVQSSQALAQFQADHGLEATGYVDTTTFNTLVSAASSQLNANETSEDQAFQTAVSMIQN